MTANHAIASLYTGNRPYDTVYPWVDKNGIVLRNMARVKFTFGDGDPDDPLGDTGEILGWVFELDGVLYLFSSDGNHLFCTGFYWEYDGLPLWDLECLEVT